MTIVEPWHQHWTTEGSAEIVLPRTWAGNAGTPTEGVVRVKQIIAEIIEGTTVPLVRAGTAAERELPAGGASVLGLIG